MYTWLNKDSLSSNNSINSCKIKGKSAIHTVIQCLASLSFLKSNLKLQEDLVIRTPCQFDTSFSHLDTLLWAILQVWWCTSLTPVGISDPFWPGCNSILRYCLRIEFSLHFFRTDRTIGYRSTESIHRYKHTFLWNDAQYMSVYVGLAVTGFYLGTGRSEGTVCYLCIVIEDPTATLCLQSYGGLVWTLPRSVLAYYRQVRYE